MIYTRMLFFLCSILCLASVLGQYKTSCREIFLERPSNTVGLVGETMRLNCTLEDPRSDLLEWANQLDHRISDARENIIRPYNGSYTLVDGYNLVIKKAKLSEAGLFRCRARNYYFAYPALADAIILERSPDCKILPGISVQEGTTLTVTCRFNFNGSHSAQTELKWSNGTSVSGKFVHLTKEVKSVYKVTVDKSAYGLKLVFISSFVHIGPCYGCLDNTTRSVKYESDRLEIKDADYCSPFPCENGGSCFSQERDYTCECKEGYFGTNCSYADYCFSMPCGIGGVCHRLKETYTCECKEGYSGKHCQKSYSPGELAASIVACVIACVPLLPVVTIIRQCCKHSIADCKMMIKYIVTGESYIDLDQKKNINEQCHRQYPDVTFIY